MFDIIKEINTNINEIKKPVYLSSGMIKFEIYTPII